ncbi:hypothetical protein CI109_103021 [Kwoniella shandongensis]|uniref:Uncharacterized protein n=1 Tax=Kwoniella shandongensis TaxID=1734106 RepID=A0A5M6C899_9TREE|nr:uncharacterized protein CI109_000208 [Kwoniella shandongensis]KAA5531367.1 hypothetical protein CI109_000208 [Kwoniella shandongensis]
MLIDAVSNKKGETKAGSNNATFHSSSGQPRFWNPFASGATSQPKGNTIHSSTHNDEDKSSADMTMKGKVSGSSEKPKQKVETLPPEEGRDVPRPVPKRRLAHRDDEKVKREAPRFSSSFFDPDHDSDSDDTPLMGLKLTAMLLPPTPNSKASSTSQRSAYASSERPKGITTYSSKGKRKDGAAGPKDVQPERKRAKFALGDISEPETWRSYDDVSSESSTEIYQSKERGSVSKMKKISSFAPNSASVDKVMSKKSSANESQSSEIATSSSRLISVQRDLPLLDITVPLPDGGEGNLNLDDAPSLGTVAMGSGGDMIVVYPRAIRIIFPKANHIPLNDNTLNSIQSQLNSEITRLPESSRSFNPATLRRDRPVSMLLGDPEQTTSRLALNEHVESIMTQLKTVCKQEEINQVFWDDRATFNKVIRSVIADPSASFNRYSDYVIDFARQVPGVNERLGHPAPPPPPTNNVSRASRQMESIFSGQETTRATRTSIIGTSHSPPPSAEELLIGDYSRSTMRCLATLLQRCNDISGLKNIVVMDPTKQWNDFRDCFKFLIPNEIQCERSKTGHVKLKDLDIVTGYLQVQDEASTNSSGIIPTKWIAYTIHPLSGYCDYYDMEGKVDFDVEAFEKILKPLLARKEAEDGVLHQKWTFKKIALSGTTQDSRSSGPIAMYIIHNAIYRAADWYMCVAPRSLGFDQGVIFDPRWVREGHVQLCKRERESRAWLLEKMKDIALWHEAMFGLNYPEQANSTTQNYNNNEPVNPLKEVSNFTIAQWFAHGLKGYPPLPGKFLELPSGGDFLGELQCNRQQTSLGDPGNPDPDQLRLYACDDTNGPPGALHNMNPRGPNPDPSLFGGSCLAISYTSDVAALRPNDMTVISCNHTSPWWRVTKYQIPAGMPECGEEGCLCTWNWVHQAAHGEGYGNEIYNALYRCKVSGQTNNSNTVPVGVPPKLCESGCTPTAQAPIYLFQAEGNNMPKPTSNEAIPIYQDKYGFRDGAQIGILQAIASSTSTGSTSSSGASQTTGTSSQTPSTAPSSSSSSSAASSAASRRFADGLPLIFLLSLGGIALYL